jgi:hypothetical protein
MSVFFQTIGIHVRGSGNGAANERYNPMLAETRLQGSILRNSFSDENFLDTFLSYIVYQILLRPKIYIQIKKWTQFLALMALKSD